jgi:hypothetical protein
MSRIVGIFASLALLASAPAAMAQEGVAAPTTCPNTHVLDAAPNAIRRGDEAALAQFLETAPCHYYITFYFAAERLFETGRKDEATRWLYVAQLRGRTVALLDPGATRSTIQAMQYVVAEPINVEAGGDREKLIEAIDWAIAWDQQHPMQLDSIRRVGTQVVPGMTQFNFDPAVDLPMERLSPAPTQTQLDGVYAQQRQGIVGLRTMIAETSPEEWRRMRQANGLQ